MKKRIAAAICAALLLTGCTKETESSAPTELVVSAPSGEEVVVSAFPVEVCGETLSEAAQRVVSLSPAVTEIIAELDMTEKLVGVSRYCDYPEGLDIAAFGSSENPDIDGIIALSPDVVFTLSGISEREVYALESAGAAVIQLTVPTTMEQYAQLYRDISAVFFGNEQTNDEKKTEIAAQTGNAKRTMLESFAKSAPLGSFIYVTGKGTLSGEGTFENAVLSLCGENLCKAEGYSDSTVLSDSSVLTDSSVLINPPAYIVVDSALSEEELRADATIAQLLDNGAKAVFVTSRCFERPTMRTAEVFTEISEQLSETEQAE